MKPLRSRRPQQADHESEDRITLPSLVVKGYCLVLKPFSMPGAHPGEGLGSGGATPDLTDTFPPTFSQLRNYGGEGSLHAISGRKWARRSIRVRRLRMREDGCTRAGHMVIYRPTEGGPMRFLVTIEQDEGGYHVVECPARPACLSQGGSREEALANIREAILLSLETRTAQGLPLDLEVVEVEVA